MQRVVQQKATIMCMYTLQIIEVRNYSGVATEKAAKIWVAAVM